MHLFELAILAPAALPVVLGSKAGQQLNWLAIVYSERDWKGDSQTILPPAKACVEIEGSLFKNVKSIRVSDEGICKLYLHHNCHGYEATYISDDNIAGRTDIASIRCEEIPDGDT